MKDFIFNVMKEILVEHNPRNICEIGTHRGGTARQFIRFLGSTGEPLHYTGYDIFDDAMNNTEFNKKEINGKNGAIYNNVVTTLNNLHRTTPNFTYELHKGLTSETLVTPQKFDFVYIDGGHSYETVKHDYSMVKESKVVVFDDLNLQPIRRFIDELIDEGIEVKIVTTPSKHIWGVIVNE